MTKVINAAVVGFGLLSIGLGAQAYFAPRAGHDASIVSLIAGGSIGLLMILSYVVWRQWSPRGGRIMSALLCVACLGNFAPKWATKGFYPNGFMAVLSGLLLALLVAGHVMAKKESRSR